MLGVIQKMEIKDIKKIMKNMDNMTIKDIDHKCGFIFSFGAGIGNSKKMEKYYLKLFNAAIKKGSIKCMYYLGHIYLIVRKEYEKAMFWFQKGADKGDVAAFFALGEIYLKGIEDIGIVKNIDKAKEYYNKAEEYYESENYARGFMFLAEDYERKNSPLYDKNKAFELYKKAAIKGNHSAIMKVILHYHSKVFPKEDTLQSMNDEDGRYVIHIKESAESKLNKEKKKLDMANIDDIKDLLYWTKVGCDYNHGDALFYMGYYYLKGIGCQIDYVKAFEYYKKAADEKCSSATRTLAWLYFDGIGTEKDHKKALDLFIFCLRDKDYFALEKIGDIYCFNEGVEPNYEKAFTYYWRAAELGNASAQYKVGVFYQEGKGCELDFYKAKEWFEKALNNGCMEAKSKLDHYKDDMLA